MCQLQAIAFIIYSNQYCQVPTDIIAQQSKVFTKE